MSSPGRSTPSSALSLPWYVWTLIAWALVTGLSALSVDIGAKVLGLLMSLELLSLVVTAFAVMFSSKKPEGIDVGASFSLPNIFVGGLGSTAGIALAFAFASYIGFEATAIYGEESKDPHKTVPRATYLAVIAITIIFGFTAFGIVTGLGASKAVDQAVKLSTVDGTPLANPANVLFTIADTYVGSWMRELMSWLVISSLFAGLLAFQNSAARYLYAMGRAGVLSERLDRVNRRGAPWTATVTSSVISLVVIVIFAVAKLDPVVNLFFWMSGMAVIAIVFVEVLVSIAVIAFFSRHPGEVSVWASVIAPILSIFGLIIGLWLLTSRFGLLAGTVAEGVDPTTQPWGLNTTGWILVIGPFAMFIVGTLVGQFRLKTENEDAIADLVT